ncbi:DUF2442 domain-containing protein [Deinococcus alpinitundrae]|uniref:DUF2442 domain-containing protein n=1 Tax=Deinococcus alpinitundrae TaxID=468913 RepID=UPI00137A54B7|nr:DUF2442 domain-containing protein [Deinococcus alpinitundrae]
MTTQGSFSPPNLPDVPLALTEVLVEPGGYQLWASFSNHQTHRVDLRALLDLTPYQSLRLDTLFARVQVSADGSRLIWPGGACIAGPAFLQTGSDRLPIQTLAVVPALHRYRPLLPYLQYQQPHTYLRATPIEPVTVQRLLQLRTGELNQILRSVPVPPEPLLNRLYDLGTFLTGHFAHDHLSTLMRRPWRYAEQQYPHHSFLHTMVGCLQHGRPDLIERPCMLIATGE